MTWPKRLGGCFKMISMKKLHGFIVEEQAQASIEYLLLVGAAMLAALIFAVSYRKMSYDVLYRQYYENINETYNTVCKYLAENLDVTDKADFCAEIVRRSQGS